MFASFIGQDGFQELCDKSVSSSGLTKIEHGSWDWTTVFVSDGLKVHCVDTVETVCELKHLIREQEVQGNR